LDSLRELLLDRFPVTLHNDGGGDMLPIKNSILRLVYLSELYIICEAILREYWLWVNVKTMFEILKDAECAKFFLCVLRASEVYL
jgi:hypothetical protein